MTGSFTRIVSFTLILWIRVRLIQTRRASARSVQPITGITRVRLLKKQVEPNLFQKTLLAAHQIAVSAALFKRHLIAKQLVRLTTQMCLLSCEVKVPSLSMIIRCVIWNSNHRNLMVQPLLTKQHCKRCTGMSPTWKNWKINAWMKKQHFTMESTTKAAWLLWQKTIKKLTRGPIKISWWCKWLNHELIAHSSVISSVSTTSHTLVPKKQPMLSKRWLVKSRLRSRLWMFRCATSTKKSSGMQTKIVNMSASKIRSTFAKRLKCKQRRTQLWSRKKLLLGKLASQFSTELNSFLQAKLEVGLGGADATASGLLD